MKITIDELINMNKNEIPKRIKIENDIFIYDNEENDYIYEDGNISLFNDYIPDIYHLEDLKDALNQQVEILEEEKKAIKPLTKKDIEALGYACGEIQKCFTNGWTKSLENKPLEEEKKIPEKLEYYDDSIAWVIDDVGQLSDVDKVIIDKLNQLIDYLKSKGE